MLGLRVGFSEPEKEKGLQGKFKSKDLIKGKSLILIN